MLPMIVGGISILYFLYIAYNAIMIGGILNLYSLISLIYYAPYLIAGIFLIKEENRELTILAGLSIPAIYLYINNMSFRAFSDLLTTPLNLVTWIVIPALIIYAAVKEY